MLRLKQPYMVDNVRFATDVIHKIYLKQCGSFKIDTNFSMAKTNLKLEQTRKILLLNKSRIYWSVRITLRPSALEMITNTPGLESFRTT